MQLALDAVLWVPAGVPWRKADREVSPVADRVEMVRRAIAGNGGFELCLLEAEQEGPSYMVETLVTLNETYEGGGLFLIVGSDALEDLPNWKEPRRLIELARLAVARRGEAEEVPPGVESALPGLRQRVVWVEMPRVDVASTELRRRAARGRGLRYLVPDAVEEYIRERRLYRDGA